MMRRPWAWCAAVFLAGAASTSADDWPQWQGPARTAQSKETDLLKTWPKGGPALHWQTKGLGVGFSTPSVAAGRIFTMGNRGNTEFVICLKESDGKDLWAAEVGTVRSKGGGYPGPRCTPTVDGDLVYALGINGDLVCLEAATGKERWRKNLPKDFGGRAGGWGYSESPLIDGDRLICTPGGKKATLVALDKRMGSVVWEAKVPRGDSAAYSSVIAADVGGQRQYVQFLGGGVVGVAADTGAYLWRFDDSSNRTANISTPIYHDGCVFAASAYNTGGALAKLTREGVATKAEVVYFTEDMQNQHGGMVLLDGYLYGNNRGALACLEWKTGKVMWQSNTPGKGSITYADGRLYYRNEGKAGTVYLVEVNPQRYVEHGRFNQPGRSSARAWAHPVIANGRLYIADQDVLLCYDVKSRAQ